jgi:Sulfotransferase family
MDRKANLFMVGAMKAGTTSFMDVISQHPQIYVSPIKEPNYFISELPEALYDPSRFFSIEKYFQNDFPNPLHIAHVKNAEDYDRLFTLQKGEKYISEGSTMYLHAPQTAQRIHEYNPNAKIIIITRDPLKRAFSHYKMDIGKGRVKGTFEALITRDITASRNQELPWHSYLAMSLYKGPIERFKSLFSNVLVIDFENLIDNEKYTLAIISTFLDIDTFGDTVIHHKNITRRPLFPKLFYLLKRIGFKDYFSKIFSSTFKQWLFRNTSSKEKLEIELSEATLEDLKQIFSTESQI